METEYKDWRGRWVAETSPIIRDEDWYIAGPEPRGGGVLLVTAFPDLSEAHDWLEATARGTATIEYALTPRSGRNKLTRSPDKQTYKTKYHGSISYKSGDAITAKPIGHFTNAFARNVHRRQPDAAGLCRPFTLSLVPDFEGGRSVEINFTRPYWKKVSLVGLEVVTVGS